MISATKKDERLFRVWIGGYDKWQPARWDDVPTAFVAIEPAEDGCVTADAAAAFLEGFNGRMLREPKQLWAVAIPVALAYQGDLQPGQCVTLPGNHARAACICP